jgi:hypothetical protein
MQAQAAQQMQINRRSASPSPDDFSDMLAQYNELQQQTMLENMEMQKAQAFWNPLESLSKSDAVSRRSTSPSPQDFTGSAAQNQELAMAQLAQLQTQMNQIMAQQAAAQQQAQATYQATDNAAAQTFSKRSPQGASSEAQAQAAAKLAQLQNQINAILAQQAAAQAQADATYQATDNALAANFGKRSPQGISEQAQAEANARLAQLQAQINQILAQQAAAQAQTQASYQETESAAAQVFSKRSPQ